MFNPLADEVAPMKFTNGVNALSRAAYNLLQ